MSGTPIPIELKEQALMRLLPPYSWSLRPVADEISCSSTTVLNWRKQLKEEGLLMPKKDQEIEWSADQIFPFVLESALLCEHELAEYCREKGLYVDQIKKWRSSCINANTPASVTSTKLAKEGRADRRRIKTLEKELVRKDKALAETASLLVLREKYNALWEDKEEE